MGKTTAKEDRTVIMSDEYLRESGVQGGKIIAEHIVLGFLIFGIAFLIIGLFAFFGMLFGTGYHTVTTNIVLVLVSPPVLAIVIGSLLIIGGYFIHRDKDSKKLQKNHES